MHRAVVPSAPRRSSPSWELALVALLMLTTYLISGRFELLQGFMAWSRRVERFDVDELVVAAMAGFLGLLAYAWRRAREAKRETTRLVHIERILAASSEHYRSLFEYNPTAVFSLDLEGRFVSANPASQLVSGYAEEELLGMSFAEMVPRSALAAAYEFFEDVRAGTARQFQTGIVHKQGGAVELSLTGVPIMVAGEVTGVFGIAQDISARLRATHDLEQARVAADQASVLKSLFVANVSHEIRTPLTSVLAAVEMLGDTELGPAQSDLVDTADRSGRRLLRLVHDLLDFSELEAGRTRLQTTRIDLRCIESSVTGPLGVAARKKGLDLTCTVDPELDQSPVYGDPERISQVLKALLENAIKFTPSGWIHLAGEVMAQTSTVLDVRFEVRDSGIGLDREQQARAFESFSQADPSISRRYEGTGIGLAIARQLVTLMGGSIWVESAPGAGSTFAFQLPMRRQGSPEDEGRVLGAGSSTSLHHGRAATPLHHNLPTAPTPARAPAARSLRL